MNKDEKLIYELLSSYRLVAKRFSKNEKRKGKTPDFRIFYDETFQFLCEVKSIVTYLVADAIAEDLAAHDPSSMRIEGGPLFSYVIHFDNAGPDATPRAWLQVSPHDPLAYGARRLELRRI